MKSLPLEGWVVKHWFFCDSGIADQNIVGIAAFLPWLAKLAPNLSGYAKGMEYFGAPGN